MKPKKEQKLLLENWRGPKHTFYGTRTLNLKFHILELGALLKTCLPLLEADMKEVTTELRNLISLQHQE